MCAWLAAVTQGVTAAFGGPRVIPGLRRWTPGAGGFTFRPGARVVVPDRRMHGVAAVLTGDLQALTGFPVPWTIGDPRAGDIALRLGTVDGGDEGYRMTVGSAVVVRGNTAAGVFLGTRTLLQLLHQHKIVPGGTATDWPAYPERGLMLDLGRRYFTLSFLYKQIRELAYLRMNHLHLHLSDDLGFRLASDTHPEVTSPLHYTKTEIRALVEYAARHHVRVVPEIDVPGHMGAILAHHPELRLRRGFVDLSKPAAYDLIGELIAEFLPLFPGDYWHIGADEYVPGGAFPAFVNWANAIVRAAGKTTRMWNDGLRPGMPVSPDIVVEHWSAGGRVPWCGRAATPRQLAAAGHRIQNASFTPTYWVTGGLAAAFNAPPALAYDAWRPSVFVDGSTLRWHLGVVLHVWCDRPARTEAEIAAAIRPRLRVMAQHTWGSPKPAPLYPFFRRLIDAVGDAPG